MASRSNPIRQAGNKPVVGRGNIGPAAKPAAAKPASAPQREVKKAAPAPAPQRGVKKAAPAKPAVGRRNPEPPKAGAKKEQTRPIPKRDDRVDLRGKPADKPTGKQAVRGAAAAKPKAPGRTNPPQKPKASAPSATARPAAQPAPTAGPTPTPAPVSLPSPGVDYTSPRTYTPAQMNAMNNDKRYAAGFSLNATPSVGVPRGVGPTGPVTGARPIPLPLGVQAQRPAGPRKAPPPTAGPRKAPPPSTPGYNPGFPRM
jgi:hypothetical protein